MKTSKGILLILSVLTFSFYVNAQENKPDKNKPQVTIKQPEMDSDKDEAQASQVYVRPDKKTRFNRYVNSMFGPVALARNAATAGFSTLRNSPEEWDKSVEGFGRRFASNLGKSVIKNTTIYALDESLKFDSRFHKSRKRDFGSRLTNALISPVTARNKNGKRVFGFPRVAGTYTSSIVAAETWFPKRFDYKDGLRNGTISLGTTALFNVFKEFVLK